VEAPSDDDVKEVYARFGLAYYMAEVIHRGLCNLYCAAQMPKDGPITGPRVEEHLRTAIGTTLGQLLPQLLPLMAPTLVPKAERAVERRNYLAHHFWYERIHLTSSLSGIEELLNELSAATDLFSEVNEEIEKLVLPFHSRIGLTPELLDRALAEAMSGKDMEPLNQQRKPKREETIVAAFDVPIASGRTLLVFQTDDGAIWQLCDGGLGWTNYEIADPAWPEAKKFAGLLPAKINPRPAVSAPWTFELQFGKKATLSVHPGKGSGQVLYKLHRNS
jgi:hypothetical protein